MTVADKAAKGYAIAGKKAGRPFTLYRPSSATSVIAAGNIVQANFLALLSVGGNFKQFNKYGNPVWESFHDATIAHVGDYLVDANSKYFVAAQQTMLPPMLIECNRTVTVSRPTLTDGVGAVAYHGEIPASDTVLMQGWPCSILGDRNEKNPTNLPLDTKLPSWKILMPAFAGVTLRTSDIVVDELGRRYGIDWAELTDLGWRITALQLEA